MGGADDDGNDEFGWVEPLTSLLPEELGWLSLFIVGYIWNAGGGVPGA